MTIRWVTVGVCITLSLALTSPPSGALVVRQSGTSASEYCTIGAAVNALGSGTTTKTIFIYPGTYKEQVVLKYGGPLKVYGYTSIDNSYTGNQVTIATNLNSQDNGGLDPGATFRALSNDLSLYNLNIANTYGPGKQAVALSARGTRQGFYALNVTGYQDTLFADTTLGQQYYTNLYVEGAIDYIFGKASAWFTKSIIASNGDGAITANSREDPNDPGYYVFYQCTITSVVSGLKGKVYLGRPWRVLARVSYQQSILPDIINPAGWTKMADGATPIFMEYNNTGAGASTSSRQMSTKQVTLITKEQVLGPDYKNWVDSKFL